VYSRDHDARAEGIAPEVLDALERGERHAFVATDLLWVDGLSLADVPLLERKRQLEAVLEPSELVRVSAFVRRSEVPTLVTWGTLGFRELSYRAANSRYLAGRENPDRVTGPAPGGAAAPPGSMPRG
jgi:hypothetical protein